MIGEVRRELSLENGRMKPCTQPFDRKTIPEQKKKKNDGCRTGELLAIDPHTHANALATPYALQTKQFRPVARQSESSNYDFN